MKGINKLLNTAELAERYYSITKPGKYDRTAAVKQLGQDKNLDKKILVKVIREMTNQAIKLL